jgi:hypothetical protein
MQKDDVIYRQAAIDAVDSETVSTNPEHFKSSEKFIKFMDDADIASFGKWQFANGFNTALVASKLQPKKLPSAQPEEAIPVAWLEEQAKWFDRMDNVFATIEANNIRVMIKKWEERKG